MKEILENVCPNFSKNHEEVCCDLPLMVDLEEKLEKMFDGNSTSISLFDGCPACVRSQLEYYCGLYCHPNQAGIVSFFLEFKKWNKVIPW